MAKIRKKKSPKRNLRRRTSKESLGKLKFAESYTSLILGAIVVLIVGILIISFTKIHRNAQTSSTSDNSKIGEQNSSTSSTYTVSIGDDLWNISEKIYHDGYKWVEIAKINKLENPGLIHAGNKLTIPTITSSDIGSSQFVSDGITSSSESTATSVLENNSITGNTYVVKSGDNLWDIAVRAYGDGFRYPDIARANNLEDPSLIFSGNILQIPR